MEKDVYKKVLESLAAKHGISEAEAEREIQNVINEIFDYMDEEIQIKWNTFFGTEERPEAKDVIKYMGKLLDDEKK